MRCPSSAKPSMICMGVAGGSSSSCESVPIGGSPLAISWQSGQALVGGRVVPYSNGNPPGGTHLPRGHAEGEIGGDLADEIT